MSTRQYKVLPWSESHVPSFHRSKVNKRTHTQTDKPKAICPSNFFKVGGEKVGGIINNMYMQKQRHRSAVQ